MVSSYINGLFKELRKKSVFKAIGTNQIDSLWFYYKGNPFKVYLEANKPTKDMMMVHIVTEIVVDEFKKPITRTLIFPLYKTFGFRELYPEIISFDGYLNTIRQ